MALRFTVTQKDRTAIIFDNYYHIRWRHDKNAAEDDESANFSCGWNDHPQCSGKVSVNLRTRQLLHFTPHDHLGDQDRCDKHVFRRKLKVEVVANSTVSIPQIFEKQLRKAHDEGKAAIFPGLVSTHRNLRKNRKKHARFVEAKTMEDVDVTGENGRTRKGHEFLLWDFRQENPPRNMIVFATDEFIRISALQVTAIQMDGTFHAAPKLFSQLYTVHGAVGGKSMPLLYAFMGDKTQDSYRAVFGKFRERILHLVPGFVAHAQWTYVMSDFERAAIGAFREVFPQVRVVGCYFHHCQAIHRHIATRLHQKALYDDKGGFHAAARRVMCLALLPLHEIFDAFEDLQEALADDVRGQCQGLLEYYTHTWLDEFRQETICVSELPDRTNNKVEGWHNRINTFIGRKKLGCHETIRDLLKKEQHIYEALVVQHHAGKVIRPPRRKKYVDLDTRLANLTAELNNNHRTRLEFLAAAAHLAPEFVNHDDLDEL